MQNKDEEVSYPLGSLEHEQTEVLGMQYLTSLICSHIHSLATGRCSQSGPYMSGPTFVKSREYEQLMQRNPTLERLGLCQTNSSLLAIILPE